MLRKFGFPAVVLGTVLALAAPIAGLARDRDDYDRDNNRYSYNESYRDNDRVQYSEHAQEVRDAQRYVRVRRDWDPDDTQRQQGIRSRGLFSNRYAVENGCR